MSIARKEEVLMPAHVLMLQLTSRTMRNILPNGTSGRRSRRVMVPKHHGVVKFGTCTMSGVISRSAAASLGESTMIKNGKCINVENMKNKTTDDDDLLAFPTMPCTSTSKVFIEPKFQPKAWGESSSMPWCQDLLVGRKLIPTPTRKKQC